MDNRKRVDEALPFLGALLRGIGSIGTRAASVGAKTGAGATRAATTTSKVGKFRQGLNLVRGMKQKFQDKRAAKKKARLAADQTMADTDMVQPDAIKNAEERAAFDTSMRAVRHSPGRPRGRRLPRQDLSTHYITKAGAKFLNEDTAETRGARLQRIAREHFRYVVRDEKNHPKAQALRDKYRKLLGEPARGDESVEALLGKAAKVLLSWGAGKALDWGARKFKGAITKAKGHDLPRVEPLETLTPKQQDAAYTRVKKLTPKRTNK